MKQAGLSIVELLITILLSTILLLGVLQLFTNTTLTDRTNTALGRVQESGRLALELIGKDARRAGYQGCVAADTETTVGSVEFPDDAIALDADGGGITFRYATTVDTGTAFPGENKSCSNEDLFLNVVRYYNCGTRLCLNTDDNPILDNANLTAITIATPQGSNLLWVAADDAEEAQVQNSTAVNLSLQITEALQGDEVVQRVFSNTYQFRNRAQ